MVVLPGVEVVVVGSVWRQLNRISFTNVGGSLVNAKDLPTRLSLSLPLYRPTCFKSERNAITCYKYTVIVIDFLYVTHNENW